MPFIVFGIIFGLISIIPIVMRNNDKKRLAQLVGSDKQKLGELVPVLNETKASLGDLGEDGAISENVTVMGNPKCEQPLKSPLGGVDCIYYKYVVKNIWTEHYSETDSNGNSVSRTRRHEDTMDEGESCTPFILDDGTGSIKVDPVGGTFEGATKVVDRSEHSFNMNTAGNSITLGGWTINLGGGGLFSNNHRPETVKYTEEVIAMSRPLTVVGNVCVKMGELCLQNNGKTKVIISTKSADEMVADAKKGIRNKAIGFVIIAVLALICFIAGAVSLISG